MTLEFEVEHEGEMYYVTLDVTKRWEDDSFNCHVAGMDAVHKCGHWEIDWDSTDVVSCTDGDGEEIEPGYVKGLWDVIVTQADSMGGDDA